MLQQKGWKKSVCHPTRKNADSCYNDNTLRKIQNAWNTRKPHDLLNGSNTKDIWNNLKQKLASACDTEKCWIKQKIIKENLPREILDVKKIFAPTHPKKWFENKNEWLSNFDIENVLKQYEETYKNFTFIGPTPIDFDVKKSGGECVWPELCNFNLEKYIKRGKNKIGIVFNTDPHDKEGAHWIAMFVDINKDNSKLFFFDSTGDTTPTEIKNLQKKILEQGKDLGIHFKVENNHNLPHQKGTTECGIYCLYLIINLLENKKDISFFKDNVITDEDMEEFRTIYFNSD